MAEKEFSDTKESIDRASRASGARDMLEDLAKKMRSGGDDNLSRYDYPKVSICDELRLKVQMNMQGEKPHASA